MNPDARTYVHRNGKLVHALRPGAPGNESTKGDWQLSYSSDIEGEPAIVTTWVAADLFETFYRPANEVVPNDLLHDLLDLALLGVELWDDGGEDGSPNELYHFASDTARKLAEVLGITRRDAKEGTFLYDVLAPDYETTRES